MEKKDDAAITPIFSIIMPVYNSATYLNASISSILAQTYSNFELIIVDDNSTDKSFEICKFFASKDSRIILLETKSNSGAAQARNLGLIYARGEYIYFMDSDDEIDDDLLEVVLQEIRLRPADCLKFGISEEYYDSDETLSLKKIYPIRKGVYSDPKSIFRQMFTLQFGYLWNSIYKHDLIKKYDIKFNSEYRVNEDFDFNIQYFKRLKTLNCFDYLGYHYKKRNNCNSLSSQKSNDYYRLHMMLITKYLSFYPNPDAYDDEINSIVFWWYTRFIYSTLLRAQEDSTNIKNEITTIKADYLYNRFLGVNFISLSIKQKIMIRLLKMDDWTILLGLTKLIGWTKKIFPNVFATIKW